MTGTIAAASIFGCLLGQLSVGIPLGRRLNRERRATQLPPPAPRPWEDRHPDPCIEDWPDDEAANLLNAWGNTTHG